MKANWKRELLAGIALLAAFILWTILIQTVDVQAIGPNGTKVGFAAFNGWFHQLTGVHWTLYTVTDWLGLVPILICMGFGCVGLIQWIKRKNMLLVDGDILLLGVYYILVIFGYLFFEMVPINYRPVLIDGFLEASYPSSTTLLVLSVMPTLALQMNRRCGTPKLRRTANAFCLLFSAFMVIGRLIAGVHWATDIAGSVMLSFGLFNLYRASVGIADQRGRKEEKGGKGGIQ
ncbi:MAG: phosphatase PAP2 family protein [Clostridia bacterium]|nr:phosphatase PAP2 family protein [Clostridia bacterium]